MDNGILSTEKVFGKKKSKPEKEDQETTTVHIESEASLRSDLAYLAKKMGIDIEQLKKERREAERQAKEAKQNGKIEHHREMWAKRERELEELFVAEYGKRFFLTLNGIRLTKITRLDDFTCPQCGEPINIRGHCQAIAELPPDFVNYSGNPLSKWLAPPGLSAEVKCKNKHVNQILIQQLLG